MLLDVCSVAVSLISRLANGLLQLVLTPWEAIKHNCLSFIQHFIGTQMRPADFGFDPALRFC